MSDRKETNFPGSTFRDLRDAVIVQHSGRTTAECPACRPQFEDAQRLRAAKMRKVYGKVSANARREHAATQRIANEIFDRLYREHSAAVRDHG